MNEHSKHQYTSLSSPRIIYGIGFLTCLVLFLVSLYFEFVMQMQPCPLCILQRLSVIVVGLLMLMAAIHNPKGRGVYVYGIIILVAILLGASVSARQVWLQSFPHETVSSCGAGLYYMLSNLPLNETLKLVLHGSGECDIVHWSLWGLSMAGWLLLFFALFAVMTIYQMIRGGRWHKN